MKQEDYRTYILNKEFGVIKEERNSINFKIKNNKDNHIKDKNNFYKKFENWVYEYKGAGITIEPLPHEVSLELPRHEITDLNKNNL